MTTHYGIIGCGMMGHEHIRNILLMTDAKVEAIYEPDQGMRETAKALVPEVKFCDTLDNLLNISTLDTLVIASPNYCHADQLEFIVSKVQLPILVEKPLYTDADDLSRIRRLSTDYTAPIWVAMEYRYMPPMQQFLEEVDDFTGGIKMLTIQEHRFPFLAKVGNWNRLNAYSGGTMVEKCCHFFDLMRFTLRSDPVRLMASAGQEVNHLDEVYDFGASDIWDCGYVVIDFANGARAALELSMFAEGSEYQEMVHAIGPLGKLEVKIPGPARLWTGAPEERPIPQLIRSPRIPCKPTKITCPIDETILDAGDHNGATYHQHRKFLEVIRASGKVEVSVEDGIWAVRMGLAAQQSAREGKLIDF